MIRAAIVAFAITFGLGQLYLADVPTVISSLIEEV